VAGHSWAGHDLARPPLGRFSAFAEQDRAALTSSYVSNCDSVKR